MLPREEHGNARSRITPLGCVRQKQSNKRPLLSAQRPAISVMIFSQHVGACGCGFPLNSPLKTLQGSWQQQKDSCATGSS